MKFLSRSLADEFSLLHRHERVLLFSCKHGDLHIFFLSHVNLIYRIFLLIEYFRSITRG